MRRARFLLLLLWLLALGLTGWTLSRLPLAELGQSLQQLTLPRALQWFALNAAMLVASSLRWSLLCRGVGCERSWLQLLPLRQAGATVSFLTPGPNFGGEPLQLYWLCSRLGLRLPDALLALGLDRLLEVGTNLGVVLLAVLWLLAGDSAAGGVDWRRVALLLALVALALGGVLWLLLQRPQWLAARLAQLPARWRGHPRLQGLGANWQDSGQRLRGLLSGETLLLWQCLLLSLAGWGLLLLELQLLLHWLQASLDLQSFVLLVVSLRLAMLLPTPGGLGSVEAAVAAVFQWLALPAAAALGLLALMRLRDALLLLLGSGCFTALQWADRPPPPPR